MMMAAVQGLGPESLRPVNLRDFQAACKAQKKSVEVRDHGSWKPHLTETR
jgi:hypothetical protein